MGISGTDQALMFALSDVMRAGASRAGYHSGAAFISIGGIDCGTVRDDPTKKVLVDSLSIADILDETPNTCTLTVMGLQPALGAEIVITLGSVHNTTREFAGIVLATDSGYLADVPANGAVVVQGIDYTYLLNLRKALAFYQTRKAEDIVADLLARFTSGFTQRHVQPVVTTVDEISFTNQNVAAALTQLAKRVGAYWFVDYDRDVHFFHEESTEDVPDPRPITASHPSVADVRVTSDFSQVVSEVLVEGGGSAAVVDCDPGETLLPVTDEIWYPPAGTVVAGPQRIDYTRVDPGGRGAMVGQSVSPSVAPDLRALAGSGVTTGVHQYAYTWVSINGETLIGPPRTVACGPIPTPQFFQAWTVNLQFRTSDEWMGWDVGDAVTWACSYATDDGPHLGSPLSFTNTVVAEANAYGSYYHDKAHPSPYAMAVRLFYSPNPLVTRIYMWMQINGGPYYTFHNYLPNRPERALENGGVGYFDYYMSSPFYNTISGQYPPNPNTYNQVAVTGLSPGPTAIVPVLSRKVYRTVAGGTTFKLLTTINNNSVTTFVDTIPDASLGANAPTSDTAQIPMPDGTVKAGATFLPLTGTGPFVSQGGWARVGNMLIRYTGVTGTASGGLAGLLGVPAAGVPGALTGTLNYGTSITPVAALVVPASGPGAIVVPIKAGENVNVLARAADPSLQTSLAGILGGDGVIQDYFQDGRLSYAEAVARAQAHLAMRSRPIVTVTYTCRDRHTRSGRTVQIDLETPAVSGLFKIQQVAIGNFQPNAYPTYSVTASSERVSFEDLLRATKGAT